MNYKQSELFHYALEQIEKWYKELIISNMDERAINRAQLLLGGLKHVVSILINFNGAIKREDMKWVAEWFEAEDFEKLREYNDYTGICTDEELEDLIDELKNM